MFDNRNRVGAVLGILLVLAGLFFLAGQFLNFDIGRILWPFFVIGFGGLFFVGMLLSGRSSASAPLAIPGSIIVTVGLILLFQTFFNYWEGWSYGWALIVAAVGIGMVISGYWSGQEGMRTRGWGVFRTGIILFLVFGAFFELVLGFSRGRLAAGIVWPLALILVGAYLVVRRLLPGNSSGAVQSSAPTSMPTSAPEPRSEPPASPADSGKDNLPPQS